MDGIASAAAVLVGECGMDACTALPIHLVLVLLSSNNLSIVEQPPTETRYMFVGGIEAKPREVVELPDPRPPASSSASSSEGLQLRRNPL